MNTYIILRRSGWANEQELEAAAARSGETAAAMAGDVSWIRTYVLAEKSGALGSVCVFQATTEDKLREHAECADLRVDEIIPVGDLVVMRPDPAAPTG